MRTALSVSISLLAACASEPPPAAVPEAAPPPAAVDAPERSPTVAPAPGDPPAAPPEPAAPEPALASIVELSPTPTVDELLVLRFPEAPVWRGLRRAPGAELWTPCELLAPEGSAHLGLVRGEVRLATRRESWPVEHTCEVVRADERLPFTAHALRPMTRRHVGTLILGARPADQPWLDGLDLEKGPQRAILGETSGTIVFASGYLDALGSQFAVPHRPLMSLAALTEDLDARARAGDRIARLNLAQHFAPQVPDAADRVAFAKLPVLTTAAPGRIEYEGAAAIPLQVGGRTRWLMLSGHVMKSSWEQAFRRGRVIERVVEDGARP